MRDLILLDDEDLHLLGERTWHIITKGKTQYVVSYHPTIYIHQLVMKVDGSILIDHRNRNGLDNRKDNLRRSTKSLNGMNVEVKGYRGVTMKGKRYQARCSGNNGMVIGRFDTEIEAAKAVDRWHKIFYPSMPEILNFPIPE